MATKAFKEQVGSWVADSKTRTLAVIKQSANDVVNTAQKTKSQGGRMPVDTGNLRNSLIVALNGTRVGKGQESYINAIPLMKLGDELFVGWTAAYARRVEYGFHGEDSLGRTYDQDGAGFLRLATQKWRFYINRHAKRLRFRSLGKYDK